MAKVKLNEETNAARMNIDEAVRCLIDHRHYISFTQMRRILAEALPLSLTRVLVLGFGAIIVSAFTLGWQGHGWYDKLIETREVSPRINPSSGSPKSAVSSYYSLLNAGQYEKAWLMLASHQGGYENWIGFWKKIDHVDVEELVIVEEHPLQAELRVHLVYHKKSEEVVEEHQRIQLVRDEESSPWKLGKTILLRAR